MDKWAQKRIDTGFSTVEKNRIAIQILLGRSTEGIPVSEDTGCELPKLKSTDKQSMIARGCSYGSLSQQAREHGIFTMLLAKFHQLVFISYCTVLLSVGNSEESINWMMRRYISDTGPKNLKRYRSGCLFVNQCVASLLDLGWGHKSWEVFLLCPS